MVLRIRPLAWRSSFALAPRRRARQDDLITPVRVGRADAPLTLNVWAQPDYFHLAARPAIANAFTIVLDDWARAHPGVQLHVSVMPGLELHKTKLQLASAAGRLPDLASIDSYWLPLFANDVQPMEPYWPAEDRADFLPFTIQTLSDPAGHVLGLWHETDCRVLFYRKDLVPVPPRTWERAARHGEPRRARAEDVRLSLQRRPMGRRRSSITSRCSGRRAASWSIATAGRFFGEEPNRSAMLRAARLPARHDPARRVAARRCSATPTISS